MTDLITFWGCELKGSTKEATWAPGRGDETALTDSDEVMLTLSQACVGVTAKEGEWNVVDVATKDRSGEDVQHTIVHLKRNSFPHCQLSILLTSEATFKLVQGSGPIHITGEERISFGIIDDDDESDEEELEESVTEDPTVVTGTKNKNKLPAAPIHKASVQPSKPTTQLPVKSSTAASKDTLISAEAEEDEDESEESDEEDSEGDEGLDMDGDDDNDDSEEDEDDDEEEEEADIEPPRKKKKSNSLPAPTSKGSPLLAKKTPAGVASQKAKQRGSAKTPPIGGVSHGQSEIEKVKQKLLQSPNIPKKKEKFFNFVKHTHKLQDEKTQNEIWEWWQQQKKRP